MSWFKDLFIDEANASLSRKVSNGSGGVSSWNDLTDKPFGEETTTVSEPLNITWDGNTEGLLCVMDEFYKVSDLVLTDEQIKTTEWDTAHGEHKVASEEWSYLVEDGCVKEDFVFSGLVLFTRKDNVDVWGAIVPEKGIYFARWPENYITNLTSTAPVECVKTVVKEIDKKYMPFKALLVNFRITGGASATGTANMTYREVCEMFDNGECFMAFSLSNHSDIQPIRVRGGSRDTYIVLICMSENNNGDMTLYWYPDETISMEEPET